MTWNHRVIRTEEATGVCYAIHECFYETPTDMIPHSWTKRAVGVVAETRCGLLLETITTRDGNHG